MTGDSASTSKPTVTIDPEVLVLLVAHAITHRTTSISGALVGTYGNNTVRITNAYPICHETPTKVLVEMSLALVQSSLEEESSKKQIVGWYTAPELFRDTKPSPVALRIAASLANGDAATSPVLVVLNNEGIAKVVEGKEENVPSETIITVYGKDFGEQWMEPLTHNVSDFSKAVKAIVTNKNTPIKDLVDHWEAGTSSEWTTTVSL